MFNKYKNRYKALVDCLLRSQDILYDEIDAMIKDDLFDDNDPILRERQAQLYEVKHALKQVNYINKTIK